jgi:hypothetical protein
MIGGTTPSEEYLARLAEQSFLSLWSYPNVFTDRGKLSDQADGKELCDLLVVFGNDILIFSDKSCEFKDTGRLIVDWNRWYRKAIEKSARQLYGAERWLLEYPNRVFIDSACLSSFPLEIPHGPEMRVHRIAVAVGTKKACRKHFSGGSGSLKVSTDIDPVMRTEEETGKAFTVGYHREGQGYIHVFDDVTLDIVMGELDTIEDFCGYLRKKEDLISSHSVYCGGEEELLARYLGTMDNEFEHGFHIPKDSYSAVLIPEGHWRDLNSSPEFLSRKLADRHSYIWDRLIEHFNKSLRAGALTEEITFQEYEAGVRRMASLSRLERRMVGGQLNEALSTTRPNETKYSAAIINDDLSLACAFVLIPPPSDKPYEVYIEYRKEVLASYCNILRNQNHRIREVIGLAMEPSAPGRRRSEQLGFYQYDTWTTEQRELALADMKVLGVKAQAKLRREEEYPMAGGTGVRPNRAQRRRNGKVRRRRVT